MCIGCMCRRCGHGEARDGGSALSALRGSAGQAPATDEVPDFQRHVSPLLGRLGCNGRACHGSFRGKAVFGCRCLGTISKRTTTRFWSRELAASVSRKLWTAWLTKPVSDENHEGGKRFEQDGWEYWVLRRWIESRAPYDAKQVQQITSLEVTPKEIRFTEKDQKQSLHVIAHWSDGSSEDVTCLCRFQSNDSAIANVDDAGVITSGERGDTHVVVSYDNAVVPILCLQPMSSQVDENYPPVPTPTKVDQLIVEKLKRLALSPPRSVRMKSSCGALRWMSPAHCLRRLK